MTEESNSQEKTIEIHVDSTRYKVAPGNQLVIPIQLINPSSKAGNFQLFIEGIPANWVSATSPITQLDPDARAIVNLVLQPPTQTETGPGIFPVIIRFVDQYDPTRLAKLEVELTVSAYSIDGRIGVMMESTQFSVSPGNGTTTKILLHNQGLVEDDFRLSVDGIPVSWISTPSPVTKLDVGEKQVITMTILPPPGSATRAGRFPFKLQVTSLKAPDQIDVIECTLTVSAVNKFICQLDPGTIEAKQLASVVITNQGNIQDTYTISWTSEGDAIAFDPPQAQSVQVSPGESASVEFSARPYNRPFFGNEVSLPFNTRVKPSSGEAQTINGHLTAKPMLPIWVIPVVLVLCLGIICVAVYFAFFKDNDDRDEQATQTAIAMTETYIASGGIQTPVIPTDSPPPTLLPTDIPTEIPLPSATLIPTDTPVPTPTDTPTNTPTVIPNVGRIAFQSNRDGDPELYIQDTGTGAIARLTQSLGVDTNPDYSPDGSRLAFMSDRTGDNEIYIANADGSNPINITNNPATDQNPSWSPDGQWIAFATNRDGNLEIYIMRPDGSNLLNLTNNPTDDQAPSWFSLGIAFQSNRDGNQEIYLMGADGSNQRNLTQNPADDSVPEGAPNGSQIAFTSLRDGNPEVYLMGVDGSNQRNLTNNPAADQAPAWSRDSNWVAFITDRDANQEIYIIRIDASQIYNITNHPAVDIVPTFQ